MIGKLVGAMRKTGSFTPTDKDTAIEYDNIMLYVLERLPERDLPDRKENGDGYRLVTLKIKSRELHEKTDFPVKSLDDIRELYNSDINYAYDNRGNVDHVSLGGV